MSILKLISGGSYWVINKPLARLVGVDAALLFSDLSQAQNYWNQKTNKEDYFYKVETDIEEDTTLSPHKQKKARARLQKAGILKTKRKGLPAKIHYLIDKECQNKLLNFLGTGEEKIKEQDPKKFEITKEYNNSNKEILKEIETEKKPLPFLSDLRKVLNTFEELTGFKAKVPAEGKIKAYGAYKLVKARREEGYSLEELINVVRFKCGEWLQRDKMRQYCNYNTILRKSNFEKYLQEVNIIQTTKTKTFSNDKTYSKKRDLRAELGEILKKGRQSGYL